ncbi:phospholipase D-like domain-containing protein [Bacillus paranthracis]|uniref:phospholipase D-like domain-containing protein n=1 Tax=Bacillus paranthracis TaxID=2026186 RepID=UPI000278FBA0|nr:phospholipase D-like domain-containing protein [Bacillus paranthracis]EJQ03970.1 hypothetical protein IC5_02768 [Bacillus cereus AND1407]MDG0908939.1 phospholipase D-like domain-containing protein [Bacillus paranthracis]HDR7456223.1 hypothetical protein [Bacillus paranthracis]HDR7472982.1 hypothetical protein [Bacillus paranthracis]
MPYRTYFYIPDNNRINEKHIWGSSPSLLQNLKEEIKGAQEIKLSMFLYNNPELHRFLEGLSSKGVGISIYSLPLAGYDKKSVQIYRDNYESNIWSSKYKYAELIYNRIRQRNDIELKIFPHTYIWAEQWYSRGRNLYSLHNKSIMATFPDGRIKCISSSCNFAFGDPKHSENMIVIENEQSTINMFNVYFNMLDRHSISLENYEANHDPLKDIRHAITPINIKDEFQTCYFTSPFIEYGGVGSNHYVQQKIIEFIRSAKSRIYICAQHVSDIDSYDRSSGSIVKELCSKANETDLDIKVLKQTRPFHQAQGQKTELTEQELQQYSNVQQRCLHPIIHDKFIIVDNAVLITTANFTNSQFAWHKDRLMRYKIKGEERIVQVKNTFSEVNSFHFVDDVDTTRWYNAYYNKLWEMAEEI